MLFLNKFEPCKGKADPEPRASERIDVRATRPWISGARHIPAAS